MTSSSFLISPSGDVIIRTTITGVSIPHWSSILRDVISGAKLFLTASSLSLTSVTVSHITRSLLHRIRSPPAAYPSNPNHRFNETEVVLPPVPSPIHGINSPPPSSPSSSSSPFNISHGSGPHSVRSLGLSSPSPRKVFPKPRHLLRNRNRNRHRYPQTPSSPRSIPTAYDSSLTPCRRKTIQNLERIFNEADEGISCPDDESFLSLDSEDESFMSCESHQEEEEEEVNAQGMDRTGVLTFDNNRNIIDVSVFCCIVSLMIIVCRFLICTLSI